jgi:hypothetical protein
VARAAVRSSPVGEGPESQGATPGGRIGLAGGQEAIQPPWRREQQCGRPGGVEGEAEAAAVQLGQRPSLRLECGPRRGEEAAIEPDVDGREGGQPAGPGRGHHHAPIPRPRQPVFVVASGSASQMMVEPANRASWPHSLGETSYSTADGCGCAIAKVARAECPCRCVAEVTLPAALAGLRRQPPPGHVVDSHANRPRAVLLDDDPRR